MSKNKDTLQVDYIYYECQHTLHICRYIHTHFTYMNSIKRTIQNKNSIQVAIHRFILKTIMHLVQWINRYKVQKKVVNFVSQTGSVFLKKKTKKNTKLSFLCGKFPCDKSLLIKIFNLC